MGSIIGAAGSGRRTSPTYAGRHTQEVAAAGVTIAVDGVEVVGLGGAPTGTMGVGAVDVLEAPVEPDELDESAVASGLGTAV